MRKTHTTMGSKFSLCSFQSQETRSGDIDAIVVEFQEISDSDPFGAILSSSDEIYRIRAGGNTNTPVTRMLENSSAKSREDIISNIQLFLDQCSDNSYKSFVELHGKNIDAAIKSQNGTALQAELNNIPHSIFLALYFYKLFIQLTGAKMIRLIKKGMQISLFQASFYTREDMILAHLWRLMKPEDVETILSSFIAVIDKYAVKDRKCKAYVCTYCFRVAHLLHQAASKNLGESPAIESLNNIHNIIKCKYNEYKAQLYPSKSRGY